MEIDRDVRRLTVEDGAASHRRPENITDKKDSSPSVWARKLKQMTIVVICLGEGCPIRCVVKEKRRAIKRKCSQIE